jgi:hypothetical protein
VTRSARVNRKSPSQPVRASSITSTSSAGTETIVIVGGGVVCLYVHFPPIGCYGQYRYTTSTTTPTNGSARIATAKIRSSCSCSCSVCGCSCMYSCERTW